jgi:secondary thiamine-phosphate synthase enzyme
MLKEIEIETDKYISFTDITQRAKDFVRNSNIKDGILLVYTPHTTAGITINEDADPAVTEDITNFISNLKF